MATIDLTTPLTTGSNTGYLPDRPYQLWEGPSTRVRRRVFFVGQPDWQGNTPTAADVVKTQVIDQGCFVTNVFVNVITAGPAGSTISVGDSASATQYVSGFSTAATGITVAPAANIKWYTAADNLLVTLGATVPTGAVIDVGFVGISVIPYTNE